MNKNKIQNESKTARLGFFEAHLQHYFGPGWAGLKLLDLFFQNWGKFELELILKMMQSSEIIASLAC